MNTFKDGEIEVLMVDDQKDILELSQLFLEKHNEELNVDITTNPEEVTERTFNENYDAIISDYEMPQMTGLEILEEVREKDPNFPFILYTGRGTEEVAAEAISKGVTDYHQKEAGTDHYQVIANEVQNSVQQYRETARKEIFEELVENSENPIVVTTTESEIIYVNPAFEEVTGYTEEEVLGENPNVLKSGEHTEEEYQEMYKALEEGEMYRIEDMTNVNKDEKPYKLNQQLIPISVHESDETDYFAAIAKVLGDPEKA